MFCDVIEEAISRVIWNHVLRVFIIIIIIIIESHLQLWPEPIYVRVNYVFESRFLEGMI